MSVASAVPDARGLFRRRFRAIAHADGATAEVEDDHHHMAVELRHDGSAVTAVEGRMIRRPFNICIGATDLLDQLLGVTLSTRPVLPAGFAAKEHCTHLLDIAILAISQSARGGERRYEFLVPDWVEERTSPCVSRDGREVLRCELLDDTFISPELFVGQTARGILPWAEQNFDDDMLEILRLLRRVLLVARGRQFNARPELASAKLMAQKRGACFTLRADRLGHAVPETSHRPVGKRPDLFTLPL